MALDDLLAAVEREGEARIAALLEEGRAEAARVSAESTEHLARRRAEAAASHRATLRTTSTHQVEEARRAARREVLEARERLLGRVFAAATGRLPAAAAGEAYAAALPAEVAEVLSYFGEEPLSLRCAPALAGRVRELVAGRPGVTVTPDADLATGLAAESADGAVAVESTLEGRLARLRPVLAIAVLRRVGAGGEAPEG